MSFSILIPARYNSSRFKGKPLKKIFEKKWLLELQSNVQKAVNKKNIFIVTDSPKIKRVVKDNNFNVIMSPKYLSTGTDRIAYAARKLKSKIFINVQGDEHLIKPRDIKRIIKEKKNTLIMLSVVTLMKKFLK